MAKDGAVKDKAARKAELTLEAEKLGLSYAELKKMKKEKKEKKREKKREREQGNEKKKGKSGDGVAGAAGAEEASEGKPKRMRTRSIDLAEVEDLKKEG